MEWVEPLRGGIVGLDTAPLIYFIEENPTYLASLRPFFEALDRGEVQAVASTVTLLEVLIQPYRQGNSHLVQQYRDILLNSEGLTTLSLTPEIAEHAARLRAEYNLHTPDAIQIATAFYAGASYFLTNDTDLPNLPSLRLLVLDKLRDGESQ